VEYFKNRGHENITVFVPNSRTCRPSETNQILDQNILTELKNEGYLVFTPARRIGTKMVVAYDDRYADEHLVKPPSIHFKISALFIG